MKHLRVHFEVDEGGVFTTKNVKKSGILINAERPTCGIVRLDDGTFVDIDLEDIFSSEWVENP